jgi:filamentous hemagglutinin family protein
MRPSMKSSLLAAAAALALPGAAMALPQAPVLVAQSGGSSIPGATFSSTATTLTVDQNTNRVVIDWTNFNIAQGEKVTFQQPAANAIAFNRISAASVIDGSLSGNGGVWLFSPAGLMFGPHATVNLGSLVAATASLGDNQLNAAVNGVALNLTPAASPGALMAQQGSQITATAGDVLMFGPQQTLAGSIKASGNVTLAVGGGGSIGFSIAPGGGDASLSAFGGAGSGARDLNHTGVTTAGGAVHIAAERPAASSARAVINLDGVVEAQAAGVSIDDGGSGATAAGLLQVSAAPAHIIAGGPVSILADDVTLGRVEASELLLLATGPLSLTGPITTTGDALVRTGSTTDVLMISAPMSVGGDLDLFGGFDVQITAPLTVTGFLNGAAGRDLTIGAVTLSSAGPGISVVAGRDLKADPASLLMSGPSLSAPSGPVEAVAGNSQAGNATLGSLSGSFIYVVGAGQGGQGGAVTVAGDANATDFLILQSLGDTTAGSSGGVTVSGNLTSAGVLEVDSNAGGPLSIGANANLQGASVALNSIGDISLATGARIVGNGPVALTTDGLLTVAQGASISGSAPAADVSWPTTTVSDSPAVRLQAARYSLRGTVTAGDPNGGQGDLVIRLESPGGIGDLGQTTSLLDNASFAGLSAQRIYVYGAAGQPLTVGDLTLDGSKIGALWIGLDPTQDLTIAGRIASPSSPVDLDLGFWQASDGSPVSFSPRNIYVTGQIADANTVQFSSPGDVLIGTAAFVQAAIADPNFDAVTQSNRYAAGLTPGQLLLQSRALQFLAGGRVIQQNTSFGSGSTGLSIGAPTTQTPLLVAAPELGIGGPTRVDLFGLFVAADGSSQTGSSVIQNPSILGTGLSTGGDFRLNGCQVGLGAGCFSLPPVNTVPPITTEYPSVVEQIQAVATGTTSSELDATATIGRFIRLPQPNALGDDPDGLNSPAAGRGNDDLFADRDKDDEKDKDKKKGDAKKTDKPTEKGAPK